MSRSPLNKIESIARGIGHVRHVAEIGTPQDWPIELRASSNRPLDAGVEIVDNEVEMYRRLMPPMVPFDSAARTPGNSEKESLFSERHRRPTLTLLDEGQIQSVTVKINGAINVLNIDRYSDCRHASSSRRHYHGSPSMSIRPGGQVLS